MFITPAHAQTAGAAATGSSLGGIAMLAPYLLLFVAFYFLMIRPQQKRMKALQAAVAAVKKGDSVITAGGLVAKVTKVDDDQVELELGPNVKVRAIKATLSQVLPAGGVKPAND